jgi:hypothetical protein
MALALSADGAYLRNLASQPAAVAPKSVSGAVSGQTFVDGAEALSVRVIRRDLENGGDEA